MTCMKQEFCIHEKYCQRHIGQNFDSCILFSRNSKPMTNEEWFCQLSTEEKVKALLNIHEKVRQRMRTDIGGENSFYRGDYYREWLKQPHNS